MIYDTDYDKGDWLHEQRKDRKLDELADREDASPLERGLRAHGYTPGEVEAGDYCPDDAAALLGEYILEARRLRGLPQ